ncbi:MAG: hypothetical protein ACFFBH_15450 [Promethearchaeota archaeon]
MVDLNTAKLKDLIEMRFGSDLAQEIINTVQQGIDNKESRSQLRTRLWYNVIKPKVTEADIGDIEDIFRVAEFGVFIPSPPDLNI